MNSESIRYQTEFSDKQHLHDQGVPLTRWRLGIFSIIAAGLLAFGGLAIGYVVDVATR